MPLITVHFYQPSATDHWVNRLVTSYDPPYSHCDVQFEDKMASSVFQNENVYWRKRRFKKPGYKSVTISVGKAEYDRAYNMCRGRAAQGYGFDPVGMYTLPLMSGLLFDREKKTFCSKHCAEVLQTAGLKAVADLKPAATTPSALFRALGGVAVFHADLDVMASLRIR